MNSYSGDDITIVVPAHNRVDLLVETLNSITKQTVRVRELIIVDDGSRTPIADELLELDLGALPTRVIRREVSSGAAIAINEGVANATTALIATLDSDDCYLPNYIESVLTAWNSVDLDVCMIVVGFHWCTAEMRPYRSQIVDGEVTLDRLLTNGNFVGGSSIMSVRRELFIKCGGHPEITGAHDFGFLIRMARIGKIFALKHPLLLYRSPTFMADSSLTSKYRKQALSLFKLRRTLSCCERVKAANLIRFMVARQVALSGRWRRAFRLMALKGGSGFIRYRAMNIQTCLLMLMSPKILSRLMITLNNVKSILRSKSA